MNDDQKITALLPMKAHSERVKGKNIRELQGQPLFYHVLKVLNKADWISEIIINTDSNIIAELALKLNQQIIINWRPEELTGDDITMNPLILNDLSIAKNEILLQTHATNPLLSLETLTNAKNLFFEQLKSNDSLFSVNKHQSRFYNSQHVPLNHSCDKLIMTQALKPLFEENSLFYFFSKTSFLKSMNRIGETPFLYTTPKLESFDIDTEEDFNLVSKILTSSLN